MQNITVDDLDRSILRILRQDARTTINDIAKKLDRRRATIYNRIVKMEENGVIKGYTVIPNFSSLGEDITVFVLVTLTEKEYLIADSLSQIGKKMSGVGRTLTLTSFDTTTEELGNNPLFQLSQK
ncbi:winged helix-turn-helix transcriptional regulator [archaeon]|nr:winged helix-turn-helix transcriptional regulator [archaeon]